MGTVPEAYFQFVMDYAPNVYVIPPSTPDPAFGKGVLALASPSTSYVTPILPHNLKIEKQKFTPKSRV